MSVTIDVPLGEELRLLGLDVTPQPLRVGHEGTLSLWWRVDKEPVGPTQLRVRLLDQRGNPVFQGLQPLSPLAPDGPNWASGQVIRERYALQVDPYGRERTLPPGAGTDRLERCTRQ